MMEIKCTSCGNVFDDTFGACPACGSTVGQWAEPVGFAEQVTVDTAASAAETSVGQQPISQEIPYGANANAQTAPTDTQNTQAPPSYQYQTYSYGAGQPPQGSYQQQNYQQQGYQQPNMGYASVDPNAKSKLTAGLLGIFLGGLGVHNFYLGYTGKAVAQLLISILSCGILSPVSAIWGVIEGILIITGSTITTDATGRPLID